MRRGRFGTLAVLGAALFAVVALLGGCSASSGAAGPRFVLDQNPTGVWEPVHIRLVALPPGERVAITATARVGAVWSSRAVYIVPPDGVVDLDRATPADAPWTGADGMGLFWSLRSASGAAATSDETWGGASIAVRLDAVVGGRRAATTTVQRIGLATAAPSRAVYEDGISGDYFAPTVGSEALRPGVVVLDGTDPGSSSGVLIASTLSALGYPALALSTYGPSGALDPRRIFPAERFLAALDWLRTQPGVDDQRMFVLGTSRGAPLALWAAAAYPGTVYGAIAPGGTTGLICASPVPSPAVTVDGDWVPCTPGTRVVSPATVLDLRGIPGPVVLGCAGADEQLDNGCEWMDAAARIRPAREGDAYLRAADATHLFFLPPYTPLDLPPAPHAQATEDARAALWRAIEEALAGPSVVPGR
ncbi:acyl-CoA thioesterase/BAAT N-terminal domain-containing protein [Leifsonia sp. AG29]|uniref:acyl-CoA thioesterase/BAAT N-terminal domain-containing protein n=1 Tax=Leifsonia sp. AG29 TaxID=2598860 RepID=UPI00131B9806|nr:acyl-CoA thioesterase/BAAT N-terminal domain-containing protein [Leifsonia sp. AG29]